MKCLVVRIISLPFVKSGKSNSLVNPLALRACEERNLCSQPLMERDGKTCRKKLAWADPFPSQTATFGIARRRSVRQCRGGSIGNFRLCRGQLESNLRWSHFSGSASVG